jgi:peptidoglycan/LPS O-acetylase OafA/YrhL
MLFSGVRVLGVFSVAFLLPFYVLGYAAFRYKERIKPLFPYMETISFLAFPFLVIGWHPINPPALAGYIGEAFPDSTRYIHLGYNYVIAACGCAGTLFLVRAVKNQTFNRIMAWIGLYTLDIYVVHYYFFSLIGYPASRGYNLGVILFAFVVSLSLSLAASIFVFRRNRVLKFVLLGQSK